MENNLSDDHRVSLAISNYQSARQELIGRLRMRDQAIFIFFTLTLAIYGAAFNNTEMIAIVLINPFVSVGFSGIISSHNDCIFILAKYCRDEAFSEEFFDLAPPEYNGSKTMRDYSGKSSFDREASYLVAIIFASIPSLLIGLESATSTVLMAVWVGGCFAFAFSLFLVVRTFYVMRSANRDLSLTGSRLKKL